MRASRPGRSEADTLRLGHRRVRFTHPDKVLFGASGHTKLDLGSYLERIAPTMRPRSSTSPART